MSAVRRILAVDDEPAVRELCRDVLESEGYRVDLSGDAEEALRCLQEDHYDLVLTDLKMPRRSGIDLMRDARRAAVRVPFIVVTGFPSIDDAMEAAREGAAEFLPKPFDTEHLCAAVRGALEAGHQPRLPEPPPPLIGDSPAMSEVRALIRRAAPTEAGILLIGENGTGKELVARHLHQLSSRSGSAFEVFDCGAAPEAVADRELFGSDVSAGGLYGSARGGTLFLENLATLAPSLQWKLLRLLEGGEHTEGNDDATDVRTVVAGPCDMARAVRDGRVREDLFFRVSVIPIVIPALRDRMEDLDALSRHFLEEFSEYRIAPPQDFSKEALAALHGYSWKGNVCELRHAVERMVSLARGTVIDIQDVPPDIRCGRTPGNGATAAAAGMSFREAKRVTVGRFEREYLHDRLAVHEGNVTRSARDSGMKRSAFQRLMRKHELCSGAYRADDDTAPSGDPPQGGVS